MKINAFILTIVFLAILSTSAVAQRIAVKSNLLYDATSTMNLGFEVGLSPRWTLDVSGNYNPWAFSDNRKMKLWMIQPEVRYWMCQRFARHFIGAHLLGGEFNFGGMLPWGFDNGKMFGIENQAISQHRYEGWGAGVGISYGYHWVIKRRWSLEASIGLGYVHLGYNQFGCRRKCAQKIGQERRNYFGPTKAAINLIYFIK